MEVIHESKCGICEMSFKPGDELTPMVMDVESYITNVSYVHADCYAPKPEAAPDPPPARRR